MDFDSSSRNKNKASSRKRAMSGTRPGRVQRRQNRVIESRPAKELISTFCVERRNLSIRMGNLRFTRLANAFSKKIEKRVAMLGHYFLHYNNFWRIHKTLKVTPAMAAGLDDTVRDCEWIIRLIDTRALKPKRPESYKKRARNSIRYTACFSCL